MSLRHWGLAAAVLGAFLAAGSSAWGVIERPLPLKQLAADSDFIFAGRAAQLDPARPSMAIEVQQDLKGKAPMRRLPVLLAGEDKGGKEQIVPRLSVGSAVVGFVTINDADDNPQTPNPLNGILYFEGTWIQIQGTPVEGSFRWQYTHAEPYLRRTFNGRSSELADLVTRALAGKTKWPEVQTSLKPGLGPTIGEPGNPIPTATAEISPEPAKNDEPTADVPLDESAEASGPPSTWQYIVGAICLVIALAVAASIRVYLANTFSTPGK